MVVPTKIEYYFHQGPRSLEQFHNLALEAPHYEFRDGLVIHTN